MISTGNFFAASLLVSYANSVIIDTIREVDDDPAKTEVKIRWTRQDTDPTGEEAQNINVDLFAVPEGEEPGAAKPKDTIGTINLEDERAVLDVSEFEEDCKAPNSCFVSFELPDALAYSESFTVGDGTARPSGVPSRNNTESDEGTPEDTDREGEEEDDDDGNRDGDKPQVDPDNGALSNAASALLVACISMLFA